MCITTHYIKKNVKKCVSQHTIKNIEKCVSQHTIKKKKNVYHNTL